MPPDLMPVLSSLENVMVGIDNRLSTLERGQRRLSTLLALTLALVVGHLLAWALLPRLLTDCS